MAQKPTEVDPNEDDMVMMASLTSFEVRSAIQTSPQLSKFLSRELSDDFEVRSAIQTSPQMSKSLSRKLSDDFEVRSAIQTSPQLSKSLSRKLSDDSEDYIDEDPPDYGSLLSLEDTEGAAELPRADTEEEHGTEDEITGNIGSFAEDTDFDGKSVEEDEEGNEMAPKSATVEAFVAPEHKEPTEDYDKYSTGESEMSGESEELSDQMQPKDLEQSPTGRLGSSSGLRDVATRTVLAVTKLQARLRGKQERQAVLAMRREEELLLRLEEQAFAAKRAQHAMEAVLEQQRFEKDQALQEKEVCEKDVERLKGELRAARKRQEALYKESSSLRRKVKVNEAKMRAAESQFQGKLISAERHARSQAQDRAQTEAIQLQRQLQEEHMKERRTMLKELRAKQSELNKQRQIIAKQEKELQMRNYQGNPEDSNTSVQSQKAKKKATSPTRIRMRLVKKKSLKESQDPSAFDGFHATAPPDSVHRSVEAWSSIGKLSRPPARNAERKVMKNSVISRSWSPNQKSKRSARIGLRLYPRAKGSPQWSPADQERSAPSNALSGLGKDSSVIDALPQTPGKSIDIESKTVAGKSSEEKESTEGSRKEKEPGKGVYAVLGEAVSALNRVSQQLKEIAEAGVPSFEGIAPEKGQPVANAESTLGKVQSDNPDEEFLEWKRRLRTRLDLAEGAAFAAVLATTESVSDLTMCRKESAVK